MTQSSVEELSVDMCMSVCVLGALLCCCMPFSEFHFQPPHSKNQFYTVQFLGLSSFK